MNFEESRVAAADSPATLYQLIIKDLCGEKYFQPFDARIESQIETFIASIGINGLNYEQFNELLLLFNQDRVSRAFFTFFFSADGCVKLDALPERIARFRGFAMMCFGDFRFAYKKLSQRDEAQLVSDLNPYSKATTAIIKEFGERPVPAMKIQRIDKDKTWCLGYIAKGVYETEAKALSDALKERPTDTDLLKQAE